MQRKTPIQLDALTAARLQEFYAVYLIGPAKGKPTKVGIALDPNTRFKELQVANWNDLSRRRYWWTIGRQFAFKLEQAVLAGNPRIRGEWLRLAFDDAVEAVVSESERQKIETFDNEGAVKRAYAWSRGEARPQGVFALPDRLIDRVHL